MIQRLAEARAQVAKLEQALVKELASLSAAYGFDSHESFIAALRAAGRGSRRGPKLAGKPSGPKARKRALITDRIRARVKDLLKAGKSGSQIAKAVGISLPSVQNIKKTFGLVKTRRKPSSKPKKPKARRAPTKRAAAPKKLAPPESKPTPATAEPPAAPVA